MSKRQQLLRWKEAILAGESHRKNIAERRAFNRKVLSNKVLSNKVLLNKVLSNCSKVPLDCSKKNREACKGWASCHANGRSYDLPRLYSRRECAKRPKGFTARASCAPFR